MNYREIAKTAIAIIIVGGAVAALFFNEALTGTFIPLVTAVLGYYFGRDSGEAAAYRAMGSKGK